MKGKLIISIIFLLILSSTLPIAFADVIEPGMKTVDFNYRVSNIDNYPDYVFLAHGIPAPTIEIINSSDFGFYKLSTVSIYAIRKSDFNENQFKNMDNSEIDNFFNNNPKLVKSDLVLKGSYGTVGIDNPLEDITVILEIESVDQNNLKIKKSKAIYAYTDGIPEEKIFTDQNTTPEPSRKSLSYEIFGLLYIIIPILAIITIALILIARKYR